MPRVEESKNTAIGPSEDDADIQSAELVCLDDVRRSDRGALLRAEVPVDTH